jgi:hypothetical protein
MIVTFWAWSWAKHVLKDSEHGIWAARLWAVYVHPEGEMSILPRRNMMISWRSEVLLKPVNCEVMYEWQGEDLRRRTISDQPRQGHYWLKIYKPWWKQLSRDMQEEYQEEEKRLGMRSEWAATWMAVKEVYDPQWEQEMHQSNMGEDRAKRIIAAKWKDD